MAPRLHVRVARIVGAAVDHALADPVHFFPGHGLQACHCHKRLT